MTLSGLRIAYAPQSVLTRHDPMELVIGAQGIAAVRHEGQDIIEILLAHILVRGSRPCLGKQGLARQGLTAAGPHQMLRQHIEGTGSGRISIKGSRRYRLEGGLTFQHLKPVGRNQQGARGLIQPVV